MAIGVSPILSTILWSLSSGSLTPMGFIFQIGIAYLGMAVIGLPVLLWLKKTDRYSALWMLAASAISGAVFGLIYLIILLILSGNDFSGSGLILAGMVAILNGTIVGSSVGLFYIMVMHLGKRIHAS
jgi:hypothetical protein